MDHFDVDYLSRQAIVWAYAQVKLDQDDVMFYHRLAIPVPHSTN